NKESADQVLQFPDVAGPLILKEEFLEPRRDFSNGRARFGVLPDEEVRQRNNVVLAFAERRHTKTDDIQPIVKVFAEEVVGYPFFQVAVRCRDDAHINSNRILAPKSLEFAVL